MIRVRFAENLRVSRGRLTGSAGTEVHAASFLRQRLIILDRALLQDASELKRIWLHELFHFVWQRLGNTKRLSWERLLLRERTRGELGWSAQWRKNLLTSHDRQQRTRRWREYCAESFCDTGASICSGMPSHPERSLGKRECSARSSWWIQTIRYNSEGNTHS